MKFSDACVAAIIATTLFAASPARATEEDAKTFFAEGRRLRMAGDCVNAVVQFRRALEIYPEGLGSLRNVAECEEQVGQFASARNDWWALRRAALQSNEAKYAGWEKDAEAGYNRLKSKVAKLTIKLEGEHLERVRVTIDGKPLDPRMYEVELERDLGPHTIEASYGGVSPVVARRVLTEGGSETVSLTIPAPGSFPTPGPGVAPAPHADKGPLRVGGFVALGLGVASLAGAGVALAIRQSALSEMKQSCPNLKECDPSLRGSLQSAADRGTVSTVLFDVLGPVGLIGVGVGTGLLYTGYRRAPDTATAQHAEVRIVPLPGGAFLGSEVRF